jgi:hypothetical protein
MGLRKNQTDAIDGFVGEAGADERRRREGSGWGPFSGGQLSAIIITLAIVIGFPVAAFAVTGSNVFVTDAASGTHVKVNALGQLSVAATGSVTADQAAPSAFYQKTGGGNFGTDGSGHVTLCTPALPSGKALVVTSVNEAFHTAASPDVVLLGRESNSGGCGQVNQKNIDDSSTSGTAGSHILSFQPGVVVPSGMHLVFDVQSNSQTADYTFDWSVSGYLVPASVCQSPNVCS